MWARSGRYLARLLGESGVNSRSLIEEGSSLRGLCCSGCLVASSSSAPQLHRCLSSLAAGPSEAEDRQKGARLTFTSEEQLRRRPKELAMVFTCRQCNTRSMKLFSRRAFDHGVVIVTCPGCEVKHLIADRLGWFGESGSVEDFLREKGEEVVVRKADGTLELSPEDIIGKSKAEALQQDAANSGSGS